MTKLFNVMQAEAISKGKINVAVVNPVGKFSLGGAVLAAEIGLINPFLCGNKAEIEKVAKDNNLDLSKCEIIHAKSEEEILAESIKLCNNNTAQVLMKGKIHTSHFMSAVVKKDNKLRTNNLISHIFALDVPNYHKLLFVTDAAINIAPTQEHKEQIVVNAINFLHSLNVERPKIALLSAVEEPTDKIIGSMDAYAVSSKMRGNYNAIIEGPLAFDNAISKEASAIKDIKTELAGDVDVLVTPNLESGNILVKSLVYLAKAEVAGLVLGARIPIILTSRADNERARLLSVVLACLSIK
jgi:phosphotransacetylase